MENQLIHIAYRASDTSFNRIPRLDLTVHDVATREFKTLIFN